MQLRLALKLTFRPRVPELDRRAQDASSGNQGKDACQGPSPGAEWPRAPCPRAPSLWFLSGQQATDICKSPDVCSAPEKAQVCVTVQRATCLSGPAPRALPGGRPFLSERSCSSSLASLGGIFHPAPPSNIHYCLPLHCGHHRATVTNGCQAPACSLPRGAKLSNVSGAQPAAGR